MAGILGLANPSSSPHLTGRNRQRGGAADLGYHGRTRHDAAGRRSLLTFKPDIEADGNIGDESTRKFLRGVLNKSTSLVSSSLRWAVQLSPQDTRSAARCFKREQESLWVGHGSCGRTAGRSAASRPLRLLIGSTQTTFGIRHPCPTKNCRAKNGTATPH
jgi:hypothetical protein